MPEPQELSKARRCLARAEAELRSADGLKELVEGLAFLEDVIGTGTATAASTARNLATTYAARIYARVGDAVAADEQVPEPELEHFFKVVLAFDQVGVELPQAAQDLKIAVVRRLIDRYYEGDVDDPRIHHQPVPCMQCEQAPCEVVCPVAATVHGDEGLNDMVYNRCVGTRYCGNNCPYKVRYFNWYAYAKTAFPEPLTLQLNPDVTVRARGVMEKCTFCIQRIRGAQNAARLEDRVLRDGDVVTACAQACPSDAIVFGNMKDTDSRVAKLQANHRGYHILEDTNVRPAVTYLAKVRHRTEA